MIRMYEYEPRKSVDDDGNITVTNVYHDFQNYLFSAPYDFEWDFAADKVIIYDVAYRISTHRRIQ